MTSWQSSLLRVLLSQASNAVPSIEPCRTSKILELGQSIGGSEKRFHKPIVDAQLPVHQLGSTRNTSQVKKATS